MQTTDCPSCGLPLELLIENEVEELYCCPSCSEVFYNPITVTKYALPKIDKSILTPLLSASLSCSVPLRIMEIQQSGQTLFDDILCLECKGADKSELHARSKGNNGDCSTCEGKKYIPRYMAYAYYIGSYGDNILFKSKKKGDTANAYNTLSDALAFMAFMPGGVTFGDLHFER